MASPGRSENCAGPLAIFPGRDCGRKNGQQSIWCDLFSNRFFEVLAGVDSRPPCPDARGRPDGTIRARMEAIDLDADIGILGKELRPHPVCESVDTGMRPGIDVAVRCRRQTHHLAARKTLSEREHCPGRPVVPVRARARAIDDPRCLRSHT